MSDDLPRAEVPLDRRSAGLRTARYDILLAAAERWEVSEHAPVGVQDTLRVARALFAHGAFVYDFFAAASAWSLIGVELALRDTMQAGDRIPFAKLIARGERSGHLSHREADVLRAGAQLRNDWFHGKGPMAITPGMAQEMVAASHLLVARLYEQGNR